MCFTFVGPLLCIYFVQLQVIIFLKWLRPYLNNSHIIVLYNFAQWVLYNAFCSILFLHVGNACLLPV
jgi:hypothetical protein